MAPRFWGSSISSRRTRKGVFAGFQDSVERGEFARGEHRHDALVVRGELVEGGPGDEKIGDVAGLGQGDDLPDRPPLPFFLENDLMDPSRRAPQDLEEGVDPGDLDHFPYLTMNSVPEFRT